MFEYTINQLNNYFVEAERASCSTYCESCLYCLTGYLISICTETHYEKCLRKVAKFVSEQNDRVYKPRGLLLTDPTTRGLRLIEISVLDRPASWLHISRSREFFMWPAAQQSGYYLARITDMHVLVSVFQRNYGAYRLVGTSYTGCDNLKYLKKKINSPSTMISCRPRSLLRCAMTWISLAVGQAFF